MWFRQISNDSDVVISSRIRFARNIDGYKFPHIMSDESQKEIVNIIEDKIDKNKYKIFKMSNIDKNTEYSLMEEHLISKEFVGNKNGAIILNDDSTIVAMINEEDHLRIQSFQSGFNIDKCYENLTKFTNDLECKIKFAKSEKYGYLTACPTNVGSAMRVSVMLHLPGLYKIGLLDKMFEQAINIGLLVRGMYGENTEGTGYMYQISNCKTLGVTNEDIINRLKAVITSIIDQEKKARNILMKNNYKLEDDIYRAYGILKNSRIMTEQESIKLLSKLRFGVSAKIINEVMLEKVQSLIIDTEPYTLRLLLKEDFSKEEENIKRAEYIRKELE